MERTAEQLESSSQPNQASIRVLLIDDHEMVASAVRNMLEGEKDIAFYYCAEAKRAIKVATRICPTVILLDLVMPDVDGLALLKELRITAELEQVPIIVLSSKEDAEIKAQTFALGANDYLIKLPDAIEVVARIRYHSRAYMAHSELQQTIKQLEEAHSQLLQSEKMASIGQLAAGVAHEINNPIGFIGSNINSLQGYMGDMFSLVDAYKKMEAALPAEHADLIRVREIKNQIEWEYLKDDSLQLLDESQDGINRVKKIVNDLKDFSHVDEAEWQWADLHTGLTSTLNIVNNVIKYKADVIHEYGELPLVECIASQLNQVFLNMLVNAAHAIEEHGTITINTSITDAGETVCIRFSDTGMGMDGETINKIFNPFYTTKPVGQGTGLGLSMAYGIIKRHHGHIEVDSALGKGTSFSLFLPVKKVEENGTS